METIYNKLSVLTDQYKKWCKANNLPDDMSADDLLYSVNAPPITEAQKSWLLDFIDRWNKADSNEHN